MGKRGFNWLIDAAKPGWIAAGLTIVLTVVTVVADEVGNKKSK